jgi:predicted Zn-dependent protease
VTRLRRGAAALALLMAGGCAGSANPAERPVYTPTRHDYYAFRAAFPDLVEPNYLPFMAHPLEIASGRTALVFCHWGRERFPLAVHVAQPEIPDVLQDEFSPIPATAYVEAVESAMRAWERDLEGLVRFVRVHEAGDADLRVVLRPQVAPTPEPSISVLGRISLGRSCRVHGDAEEHQLDASFEASELTLYLADDYGLLNPDQVETVALHELGHALGMRGHSPIRADLMYPTTRDDPLARGPSELDVNSFVSLYRIPSGTIYVKLEPEVRQDRLAPGPVPGPPALAAAPHVDARFGYELRLPEGWQRLPTERGMIAADGLAWDYDATFQIIVRGYGSVEAYLDRHLASHLGAGKVTERRTLRVDGRDAVRFVVVGRGGSMLEELTFIEVGDGRVVVVIADSPIGAYAAYRPWFEAILGSLEIRSLAHRSLPTP